MRNASRITKHKKEFSVFFLDEGLGGKQIATALEVLGEEVEFLRDHVEQGEYDDVWMHVAAGHGWMIVTKDGEIKRNPSEILAVFLSGACVFNLSAKKMQGAQMASVLVKARHRMKQFAFKHQGPFVARITPGGKVSMWKDREQLELELIDLGLIPARDVEGPQR